MKKILIASLTLAYCLTTVAFAQQPTQTSSSANVTPTPPRRTSSREGLDRKGGVDVGREGSAKMKDGVSRSGNSNLSPTSPTNVPPPGGDKPGKAVAGTSANAAPAAKPASPAPAKLKGTGTSNGNTSSANIKPMQTQGSTSEGSASVPSAGGAAGTGTKTVRSVQPKSRAAAMDANAKSTQASAAGQASSASKTGSNGQPSPGSTNITITDRAQKEGSASDASKRNKAITGQQTKPKQ